MPEQNSPSEIVRSGASEEAMATVKSPSLERNKDVKCVLACLAVFSAAVVLAWPFANLACGDDVAYAHVAYLLSQTGHLIFNGWEAAMMLQQAYWGALFIKLFGFSFVVIRLSTSPFALGSVALCYMVVRRAGLTARAATFVTLLFGLSPLFLPVAVTFMTDVPGIFFMFASLYSFARAEETSGERRSYGWLVLGAATGFIGGTGRQVVWLVPLIVLPYLAWVRRERWWFRISAEAAWVAVLVGIHYTTSWFNHQLYTVFTPSALPEAILAIKKPMATLDITARLVLMVLLVIFPAIIPLLFRSAADTWRGSRSRQITLAGLLLTVLAAIAIHPSLASIPWVSNTFNWEGIYGSWPLPGRPIVLIRPIRELVAVTVYIAVCVLAGEAWNLRWWARGALSELLDPPSGKFMLATMSLVSVTYFVLLVIRAAEFDIFDRYLLPIVPWAATVALLWFAKDNPHADGMLRKAMPVAWTFFGVLAFYGIASTQDLWSLAEARVKAAQRLEAEGIPRTAIDAGFEYNAWTELMISGRINYFRVLNPPGAYRPGVSQTPSVVPEYRLEYALTPETAPSDFGSVPYSSVLPPFHKQVRIDRIVKR